MSFVLNGSFIDQSGIDSNFSGLSAIAGVNTMTYNNNGLEYTIYDLGTLSLRIGGTLTQNPDIEMWITNGGATNTTQAIIVNGTYNAGYEVTINGKKIRSTGTLGIQTEHNAYYGKGRGIAVNPGGVFNWYGGEFKLGNGIEVEDGGFLNIFGTECIFNSTDPNDTMQLKFEGQSSDYVIHGLTMTGSQSSASRFFATNGIDNANNIIFKRAFIHPRAGNYINPLELTGVEFKDNSYDYDYWYSGDARWEDAIQNVQPSILRNVDVGSSLRTLEEEYSPGLFRRGYLELKQRLNVNVKSKDTGANIPGCIVYIPATDNGDRRNPQGNPVPAEYLNRDFLTSAYNSYFTVTGGDGNITPTDILTYVKFVDTVGAQEIFYSKSRTSGEDLFDVHIWNYNYEYKNLEVAMHGSNDIQINELLFLDNNLTETNRSIVQTYSEINNMNELYDYVKNVKLNYIPNPSESESFITANGKILEIIAGWTLVKDDTLIGNPVQIDINNSLIKVRTGAGGLLKTSKFDTLNGSVDASFDGNTDANYVRSDGKVAYRFININPNSFALTSSYPATIMYKETTSGVWSSVSEHQQNFVSIGLLPQTDYDINVRVPGYEWKSIVINSGNFGGETDCNLISTKDLDGNDMFAKTGNQAIMDLFSYDFLNRRIICTNISGVEQIVDIISAYIKFEQILHDPLIVVEIDDPMYLLPLRDGFKIPQTNTLEIKLSDGSNQNVYFEFTIKEYDDSFARGRFLTSASGYYISFATTIISGLDLTFPTAIENAEATRDILDDTFVEINSKLDQKPTLEQIENNDIIAKRDTVFIDTEAVINGVGTFASPYNNVADGLDDVVNNNYQKVMFMSDAEIDRELHDKKIYGCNHAEISSADGVRDFHCCSFYDVTLDGVFDEIEAYNCRLRNTNLWGTYKECSLNGALSCVSSKYAYLIDCYDETNQTEPPFDFIGLTGIQNDFKMLITGYDGTIGVTNCTDPTADISIHSDGGRVVLGTGISEGTIHLYGIYNLVDSRPPTTNSILTEEIQVAKEDTLQDVKAQTDRVQFTIDDDVKATLDTEQVDIGKVNTVDVVNIDDFKADVSHLPTLVEIETSTVLSKRDMVYINTDAATNGDGTYQNPFNNVLDGLDEVVNNNFEKVTFFNDVELDRELHNVKIYGINYPILTVAGLLRDFEGCEFYGVTLGDHFDKVKAFDCKLVEGVNLWGTYYNCGINGTINCVSSEYVRLIDCYDETNQDTPPFDFISFTGVLPNFKLLVTGYDGTIGLGTCIEPTASFSIHSDGGRIVLGAGLDEGRIHLYGIYTLIDSRGQSSNATLVEEIQVAHQNEVEAIKLQTDKLQFAVDNDLKVTLDSEQVDIGKVNTVDVVNIDDFKADLTALQSDVTAVKTKTDNLPIDTETELTEIKSEAESAKLWAIKATRNTQKS